MALSTRHAVLLYELRATPTVVAGAAVSAQAAHGVTLAAASPQTQAPGAAARTAAAGGPGLAAASAQTLSVGAADSFSTAAGVTFSSRALAFGEAISTPVPRGPQVVAAAAQTLAAGAATHPAAAGPALATTIHVLRPGPAGRGAVTVGAADLAIASSASLDVPLAFPALAGLVTSFDLGIYLEHPSVGELTLQLIAPNGTSYAIGSGGGSATVVGTPSQLAVFSDTGTDLWMNAGASDAPFTSIAYFPPESPVGAAAPGTWTLRIADTSGLEGGVLHLATLSFSARAGAAAGATVTATPIAPAPAGDPAATPAPVDTVFTEAWQNATMVGAIQPHMVVQIRRGRWNRGYREIDPDEWIGADVPGEPVSKPWMAWWSAAESWVAVPGVLSCEITNNFDQNGLPTCTLNIENTRLKRHTGTVGSYHVPQRGFLTPGRGYDDPDRGVAGGPATEWQGRLSRMAQIRIWQGYGPPQRTSAGNIPEDGGHNGGWTFVGQIDDVDLDTFPDRAVVTARAGQPLTDSYLFGWNIAKSLEDPITLATAGAETGHDWIYCTDAADVVRLMCRWAGYRHTDLHNTATMHGHKEYDKTNSRIQPIQDIRDQSGYVFFFGCVASGNHMARPVFRRNASLADPAPAFLDVSQDDLLTDIQVKEDTEALSYIIRTRGKTDDDGQPLGGDDTNRIMAVYRPPWSYQPGEGGPDRLGGLIKHAFHQDHNIKTQRQCEVAARLIALAEALSSYQATFTIPGHYAVELDQQWGVTDSATAVNSRVWVTGYESTFNTGRQTTWTTTITGSLLDTADVKAIIADLNTYGP